MWFKVVVVGLKAAAAGHKPKATEAFCRFSVNDERSTDRERVQDQALAPFCWPLGPENQAQKEFMAPEEFMFTLTQGDGSRLQGFCRRFLPPAPRVGSRLRYPQVLCLVCEVSWAALFFKVLEVTEQLLRQTDLLSDHSHQQLPLDSLAGMFLTNLGAVLAEQPPLGSVVRVALPQVSIPLAMSPPKRIGSRNTEEPLPLLLTESFIELQVPPDAGNGTQNAGVSLARLLWHVPVPAMVTLIASLLLERRVLVVGQSRDMVSAAVCAAQALLHPFRWHHIFLPLLPRSLSDYLTAPMPFLIGMPAQLLPSIRNLPMDEITLIDLDLGRCEPSPGSARDDAQLLPWREQLENALHAAFSMLRSPTEHESNPVIAGIMHGYFLKLLGSYRSFIHLEGTGPGFTPQPPSSPTPGSQGLMPPPPPRAPGHQRSRSASPLHGGSSSNALAAFAAAVTGGSEKGLSPRSTTSHGGASNSNSRRHSRASSSTIGGAAPDEGMKAHGYWFDHQGLVASHRRNDKARQFLTLLRQSQLFEVFVRERLAMSADVEGGPEYSGDPFEQLVNAYLDNRSRRLSARLGAGVRSSLSRFSALINKHRRIESSTATFSFSGNGGTTGSSGAGGGSVSASGGLGGPGLLKAKAGGLTASFAERPEALKMRQMVASLAAAADHLKRNMAEGGSKPEGGLSDKAAQALDPSTLFGDEDEDLEADLAAAEAANSSSSGGGLGRLSRSSMSMSSSSLKDLMAGPVVAPSGASWSAGASSSTRMGPLATQSLHTAFTGSGSNSSSIASNSGSRVGGDGSNSGSKGSPIPLGRQSMPAVMQGPAGGRPASPTPLIDLSSSPEASSATNNSSSAAAVTDTAAAAASAAGAAAFVQHPQQQQQQQPHYHRYLQQLQMPAGGQQQQQQPPRSPRELQAHMANPASSPRGNRDSSLMQQHTRPPLSSSGGSGRSLQQQQQQHINVKAALAAIAPGPLPQPPAPRSRPVSGAGAHILNPILEPGHGLAHLQPLRQGLAHLSQPQQRTATHQQAGARGASMGPTAGHGLGAGGAGFASSSSGSAQQPAGTAATGGARSEVWDPFAELLTERTASLSGAAPHGTAAPQQQQQQSPLVQPMAPLLLHARGQSAGSEGGASGVESVGGMSGLLCTADSSSDGDSSSGRGSGGGGNGAASATISTSTTPVGSVAAGVFAECSPQQQQQHGQLLQQQPTMPESWLSAFSDPDVESSAAAGQPAIGSGISLSGGRGSRLSAESAANGTYGDGGQGGGSAVSNAGLSQLKQAFAQQLAVQHTGTDDLL